MKPNHPPLLMVEGNIGAGKSTFLKILQDNLQIEAIFEPANKWQSDSEQENLLHLFYKDMKRWAYTFQSYAFITRIQSILEHQKNNSSDKVQILERSVYCDRYCFAKNCYESGLMTPLEWNIYKEWFSWLAETYAPRPSGFIYLKTDPNTCHSRMQKRSRSEESGVPLEYLKSLHSRHEDWLISQKEVSPYLANIPILVLDCNEEFETNMTIQKQHIRRVQEFIDQQIIPFVPTPPHPTQPTI